MRIGNILKNDKFMSSLGIAFIISFLCGMADWIYKEYISGTVLLLESFADVFRNFNACFYPSAFAVVLIEWMHDNERLNALLKILTILSLLLYTMAKFIFKILYELEFYAQEFDTYTSIGLGVYACFHICLIYKILYDGGIYEK